MTYIIDLQINCQDPLPFNEQQLNHWVSITLADHQPSAELTLRLVDAEEMQTLNRTYRKIDKSTNVLSFPASYPKDLPLEYPLLGDVIICPSVLATEAQQLNVTLEAHWAHIVIHGVLHLLGYDHIIKEDALIMRPIEIELLAQLGFDNPYNTEEYSLD